MPTQIAVNSELRNALGAQTIRVTLVDDHSLVRAGLRQLINDISGFTVISEASNGAEALEQATALTPDLILLDINMSGMSGLECLEHLSRMTPKIRVLMLSMYSDAEHVMRALELGALGYLPKGVNSAKLELALKAVSSGDVWVPSELSHLVVGSSNAYRCLNNSQTVLLTPRQQTILKRLAEGATAKAIAFELSLSVKTVETHRSQLMDRLNLYDIPSLVRYAIRNGIVPL